MEPLRILLDEQLPRVLAAEFPDHEVRTVQQQGWRGLKDGPLLKVAAEAGFDVLLTADRGIEFEQNLTLAEIAIVMFIAQSNRLEHVLPLVPEIEAAFHCSSQVSS